MLDLKCNTRGPHTGAAKHRDKVKYSIQSEVIWEEGEIIDVEKETE